MDTNLLISEGSSLFTISGSSLIINGAVGKELRIELLAERIKEYIKNKDSVRISELVEAFKESADNILKAIKKLRDMGIIEEV
ncbi:MAG: hypothetical protein AABX29_07430 [Nanoarchaeota archaeon]